MMSSYVVNCPSGGPWRELSDRRYLALHITGIAALVFVLVTSGAFGSDDLPLGRRILMFGVVSALLVVQASAIADVVRRYRKPSFIGAAGGIILALATMWVLMTVEVHALKATPIVPYAPDPLPEFGLFLLPFVVPVSALVLSLKWVEPAGPAIRPTPVDTIAEPTALRDVPLPDGAIDAWPDDTVLRIQAADHYLQLWTSRGTSLVRGRMRDALRRVPGGTGIQPHRSWWIALSEIERIERRGRDMFLLLSDGDCLPVARARTAEVKLALERRKGDQLRGRGETSASCCAAPIS